MKINLETFVNLELNTLYNYTKNEFTYGWIDSKNIKHFSANNDDLQYHLQTPEETLLRKLSICWDKTELLRYYFEKNNFEVHTYFIYLYITDNYCPSHSIITYKKDNKYIWFEPCTAINFEGIREYQTEAQLIKDFENRFLANGFLNNFFNKDNDIQKLHCYEYSKPEFHIRGSQFYNHCRTGKKLI